MASEAGIPVRIVSGFRSIPEQEQIYAKGRTEPGPIVTKAPPGSSYHNYGLAFDIVPEAYLGLKDWNPTGPLWDKLGEIGKSLGLEWGGDWRDPDKPHFQIPSSLIPIRELRAYWEKFRQIMPVSLSPTTGGIAMILLVLAGLWVFSRWASKVL